ncbi:MAG: YfhO family protein [Caldilinea sp.]|nr:YfhO family protein [Caldilinea sp.]MDW8440793.1 hypothetical protein [Caldilineaceae bacterium]
MKALSSASRFLHRRKIQALLLFLGLAAFFYAPVLLGLRTFPDGDFTHHFLPFSLFLQQEMQNARLPVWNPYTYSGHPFLADVQAAVFYPIGSLLLALTLPFDGAAARLYFLQVEAILQVALAGFFTYLLAERLTRRHDAGLVAGVSFAFSGYLTGYPVAQLAVLRTAIWLPLLLWLMLRAVESPRCWRRWSAVGIAASVSFLGGHAQTFLYTLYAAGAWLLFLSTARRRQTHNAGEMGVTAAGALLAAAVAAGLSAPQLLPSLEYMQLSVRASVDYAFVSGGFPLQDSWQLLLPGVLTYYSPLYIGVVGLGLAFVAVGAAALRSHWHTEEDSTSLLRHRWGAFFFLGLGGAALLLSFGGNGFLYPLFYHLVPGFNLFRGQERAAFLVAFGLSVLAGYGLLAVRLAPQAVRAWLATLYAGLVTGGVYIFGLIWQLPGRTAIGPWRFLLLATLAIGMAAGFALLLRLPGWSRQRTQLLILLIFASLFWANFTTNLDRFSPSRKVMLAPEVEAIRTVAANRAFTTSLGETETPPGRVYNEFRVYEDYGMRVGVEDVWGASPLRLATYARLFDAFPLDRMWRLTGVEHVLTWRRELFVPSMLLAEFPLSADTTYLHRLEQRHPRAWIVHETVVADDENSVKLLADHAFDLDRKAVLPPEHAATGRLEPTQAPNRSEASSDAHIVQRAPGWVEVTVESEAPGLLVVSENWMPGWRVRAIEWPEGAPVPPAEALRVNLSFLGVPVPAGKSLIELRYQPESVRNGLWLGAGTLAVLLFTGVLDALHRRSNSGFGRERIEQKPAMTGDAS